MGWIIFLIGASLVWAKHNHQLFKSAVLYITAGSFHWMQDIHWTQSVSFNTFYDYTLKILTLISVALVVFINWKKAVEIAKNKISKKQE